MGTTLIYLRREKSDDFVFNIIYLRRKKTPKILLILLMYASVRVQILRVAGVWKWQKIWSRLNIEWQWFSGGINRVEL